MSVWPVSYTHLDVYKRQLLTKERLRADQVPAQSGMGFFYTGAVKKDGSWSMEKEYSCLLYTS